MYVFILPARYGHVAIFSLYNLTPWWRHQIALQVIVKTSFSVIMVLMVKNRIFRQMLFVPLWIRKEIPSMSTYLLQSTMWTGFCSAQNVCLSLVSSPSTLTNDYFQIVCVHLTELLRIQLRREIQATERMLHVTCYDAISTQFYGM